MNLPESALEGCWTCVRDAVLGARRVHTLFWALESYIELLPMLESVVLGGREGGAWRERTLLAYQLLRVGACGTHTVIVDEGNFVVAHEHPGLLSASWAAGGERTTDFMTSVSMRLFGELMAGGMAGWRRWCVQVCAGVCRGVQVCGGGEAGGVLAVCVCWAR